MFVSIILIIFLTSVCCSTIFLSFLQYSNSQYNFAGQQEYIYDDDDNEEIAGEL